MRDLLSDAHTAEPGIGFRGHSAGAARAEESRKRDEQVYRQQDQIAHERKVILFVRLRKTALRGAARSVRNFGISHEQATGAWVNFGSAPTPDVSSVATKLFLQPHLDE